MTGLEAAQKFKIELNKLDRSSLIDLRVEKIIHYLNKAALFLVKKKYKGNNEGPGRLEIIHTVLDDLKPLIKTFQDSGTTTSGETVVNFDSKHLYFIACKVSTTNSTCSIAAWHEGRYIKPERVYKELDSPFTSSKFDDPIITINNNSLIIYNPDFDVENVEIKYLKLPETILNDNVTDLELDFINEIIDIGVAMALENIESNRIKTQPAINVAALNE